MDREIVQIKIVMKSMYLEKGITNVKKFQISGLIGEFSVSSCIKCRITIAHHNSTEPKYKYNVIHFFQED